MEGLEGKVSKIRQWWNELREFKGFCDANGEKTVRGTPPQNGVVEHMNRILN